MINKPHYSRHRDDEIIDEINFRVVPRYKTSGLSGDEWRVSTVVELKRKGEVMYSRGYCTMEAAAAHLPWLLLTWTEMPNEEIPNWIGRIKKDDSTCHQPGCAAPATVVYRLKKEFSREGYEHDLTDHYCEIRRAFCDEHRRRGDCGLEDSDANYELVKEKETINRMEYIMGYAPKDHDSKK